MAEKLKEKKRGEASVGESYGINEINRELLNQLYWKQGLSLSKIAKIFHKSKTTISRWMRKHKVPRRDNIEATIKANTRYTKTPFSGDLEEKAYLTGLRYGDLSVCRNCRQILVNTTTTHPAMIKLFGGVFGKYGHVNRYSNKRYLEDVGPNRSEEMLHYEWSIYCYLDSSFNFLLEKSKTVPKWILEGDEYFLAFLAGYFDSEGTITVAQNKEYNFSFYLSNTDFEILKDIRDKLIELDYHPNLYLTKKKGKENYKKDYWRLSLGPKKEALVLLQLLPLKHSERLRRLKLALEANEAKRWSEIKDRLLALRKEIKNRVRRCIQEAFKDYQQRHRIGSPNNMDRDFEGHLRV